MRRSMSALSDVAAFLESYWGRNQVFRTAQFASKMFSGLLEKRCPDTAERLEDVYCAISNMRVMLRLLDDIPVLVMSTNAWSNNKEQGMWQKVTDIVNALSGQLYYPCEHIAWAADTNLIPINSSRFWTASIVLWGVSLLINCLQAIQSILAISVKLTNHLRSTRRKKVQFKDEAQSDNTLKIAALKQRLFLTTLTLVQSLSDLVNAVGWMPPGFLWAGKLSNFWVGLFGFVSSMIGLYKILPTKPPQAI